MAVTMYGIKNCDTIKKARTWLEERGVAYGFHDYKAAGIDRERLEQWCDRLGWETLLNRAGTTIRKLPDAAREGRNADEAIALMTAPTSLIKRPMLHDAARLLIGLNR